MKSSAEILAGYEVTARNKTGLSVPRMILSGVFAGLFIALGGLGSQVASAGIGGGLGKFVGACVFPVGLFLVVTVGVELFTGNCLLVAPCLDRHQTNVRALGILKNWLFVYIGNFIGGWLLAIAAYYGHLDRMFDGELGNTMMSAAAAKMSLDPAEAIIKGILCNLLVCLAVWVAMAADTVGAKAVAVFGPVMLFVLCGFEHSVANMYFIPTGLFLGAEGSMGSFLLNNLLPVTIGNILGGACIVGCGVWALYHKKGNK